MPAKPAKQPRPVGKYSGLPLQQFVRSMFADNETYRRTDAELKLQVEVEFEAYPAVLQTIANSDRSMIQVWRTSYNHGRLAAGTPGTPSHRPPTFVSFRYNGGKPVSPQSGAELSLEERKAIAKKLKIKDARFI